MRKILHGFVLAVMVMLAVPFAAQADTTTPYPAPPVTSSDSSVPTQVAGSSLPLTTDPVGPSSQAPTAVDPTSQAVQSSSQAAVPVDPAPSVPPAQPAPAQDLAWTGSGLNVGLTLGIAGAIVLLGVILVLFGSRGLRRSH